MSAISNGGLLVVLDHPNTVQYPNQRMVVVRIRGYAYLVLFVETKPEIFLKTSIPSTKATRIYLDEERQNDPRQYTCERLRRRPT